MLFRNISYLFRNKSKTNWYIAESLYISDHKIGKYAEKPQDKRDSPRIWRTIYVSYRTGQRYNVRKRLLFIGQMFRQVFFRNQVHTKKWELRCKDIEQFPKFERKHGRTLCWRKLWICRYCSTVWRPLGPLEQLECWRQTSPTEECWKVPEAKTQARKTPKEQAAVSGSAWRKKWLRLWKTRDRLLHRMNRLVWYPALLSTVILGCAIYFSQDVKDRRGTSSDLSVCGRHCTGGVIALTSGVGFFLQRRAGDGYVGRLCGADEKLDRRDSSREKMRTLFYRKKSWIRLPVASSRQLLPEVISVRCWLLRKRRLWGKLSGNLWLDNYRMVDEGASTISLALLYFGDYCFPHLQQHAAQT